MSFVGISIWFSPWVNIPTRPYYRIYTFSLIKPTTKSDIRVGDIVLASRKQFEVITLLENGAVVGWDI
jgi:hypothetical protein